jgi:hypothetical protein
MTTSIEVRSSLRPRRAVRIKTDGRCNGVRQEARQAGPSGVEGYLCAHAYVLNGLDCSREPAFADSGKVGVGVRRDSKAKTFDT